MGLDKLKIKDLTNEAEVESRFVNPLLDALGFENENIKLKTSIGEFAIGKGHKPILYKPDYIIHIKGIPVAVIDAKAPSENIFDWEHQCSSYCLELNKLYDYNPVGMFILTNGIKTAVYKWDKKSPLLVLNFSDIIAGQDDFAQFYNLFSKKSLEKLASELREELERSIFKFEKINLENLISLFQKIHKYIWSKEKMSPSAAFGELIKILFVKLRCDKKIHEKYGKAPEPSYKDIVFSAYWISTQTENDSPINEPLLKNLLESLEIDIQRRKKKRFFDKGEQIQLNPDTIKWVIKELENIDLYGMEEDVHGRMFEAFLDATARGRELGQFFTPRDIVDLMVGLANISVSKNYIETVLDACCGSGGFLISALNYMLKKASAIPGLSTSEKEKLLERIRQKSLFGIDAGSNPPIYRIARMNMYLHGDGGSNIFWADALDKTIGQVGRNDVEHSLELEELRKIVIKDGTKFDVILTNPPFSLKYNREDQYQKDVLNQYDVQVDRKTGKVLKSLLSSVMFIERYRDLISDNGKIYAIIDESILSGQSYQYVRNYIRQQFIILGVISLPGDAFRRSAARVKTSILILRLKKGDEEQSDVFMASSIFLGIEEKTAKRIGLTGINIEEEKKLEANNIIKQFHDYLNGKNGEYVIPATEIEDRLDVKFSLNRKVERAKLAIWTQNQIETVQLDEVLKHATKRSVIVSEDNDYQFLRVSYDGQVIDGEIINGDECSYSNLFVTKEWDILYSNMGLGRGAIGIVQPYNAGKFVSNEYTILTASSEEEAVYYVNFIRTKEVLADILSANTGMNRGRIQWDAIKTIRVPKYCPNSSSTLSLVKDLKTFWKAYSELKNQQNMHSSRLNERVGINERDSFWRWLAYKPPE